MLTVTFLADRDFAGLLQAEADPGAREVLRTVFSWSREFFAKNGENIPPRVFGRFLREVQLFGLRFTDRPRTTAIEAALRVLLRLGGVYVHKLGAPEARRVLASCFVDGDLADVRILRRTRDRRGLRSWIAERRGDRYRLGPFGDIMKIERALDETSK